MNSHHENRFLYIRYSPATPCHTWADSPGGGMPCTPCHTWADSPGGWHALHESSAPLGTGFAPGWHALQKNCCVFCSVRTPVSPPFGQTRPLRGLKQCPRWRLAVQTSRRKPRNVFFAGHATHGRIQPQAVQCFRAGHAIPWANPASSGAMFPCRVCHQGRISDRFILAFR